MAQSAAKSRQIGKNGVRLPLRRSGHRASARREGLKRQAGLEAELVAHRRGVLLDQIGTVLAWAGAKAAAPFGLGAGDLFFVEQLAETGYRQFRVALIPHCIRSEAR